jgi:malonate-semialdehyde dehydrogenase (acetylating)/methylmalonate-semialdehyde dehydrogenase
MALLPEVKAHYGRQKFFINGEWVESKSTTVHQNRNPALAIFMRRLKTSSKKLLKV